METRAKLTREKAWRENNPHDDIKSRDPSNHGTNEDGRGDPRTRKELRRMQFVRYDALFCFGLKRAQSKRTSRNESSRDRGEENPRNGV